MLTVKGTLPAGFEYKGETHHLFEVRARLVKDSVEAMEDSRAQDNESYLGLCILARQVVKLGTIPLEAITAELLMDMYEVDLAELGQAAGRAEKSILPAGREGKEPSQGGGGAPETGL